MKAIKAFIQLLLATIISDAFFRAVDNRQHGKTIFGRKRTPKKTFVDVDGIVHASPEDVQVN